ncbi:MAG: ParB/RepB/Spo0J family partition protein [Bacillota bacterium]
MGIAGRAVTGMASKLRKIVAGVAGALVKGGMVIEEVPVDAVVFNSYQPRQEFDEAELLELAASIKKHGVLQPIVVRRVGAGFEVVAGERRVRACKLAGVSRVPAVVKDVGDEESAVLALVENVQRAGLSAVEEALGYQRLIEQFGWSQQEVAQMVGRSQSAVANKLRLLKLPGEIREGIIRGVVTERHARALLRLPSEEVQLEVFRESVRSNWTVERLEAEVERRIGEAGKLEGGRRKKRIGIVRDVRIFLNSFRQVVRDLRRAGVEASVTERQEEGVYEICVRIALPEGQRGKAGSVQG